MAGRHVDVCGPGSAAAGHCFPPVSLLPECPGADVIAAACRDGPELCRHCPRE